MAGPSGRPTPDASARLRLDKWLWQARFFRSRGLAAEAIEAGAVRVNGIRVTRPGRDVTEGDTLTFPQGSRIRVIRIVALGLRRGPASEAQTLYIDLDAGPA
ncbi:MULTISPECIES: RNA-binding S4 domain-containing protein [Tabrizicola]|uniref:RNA-binding S4 domain-containing protein n=1 Tax=Tabrizicola TaxID=1443919 RepID=UPI001080C231|nr:MULTISPECIES: RNA-binding S4 domain-containing protein [Paracoccaceae]